MLSRVTGISVMLGALFLPVAVGTASDAPVSFAVGQRWEYRTRPQDAGSTLVIVKINADTTHGNIISISVSGLRLKNPHSTDGLADTAPSARWTTPASYRPPATESESTPGWTAKEGVSCLGSMICGHPLDADES